MAAASMPLNVLVLLLLALPIISGETPDSSSGGLRRVDTTPAAAVAAGKAAEGSSTSTALIQPERAPVGRLVRGGREPVDGSKIKLQRGSHGRTLASFYGHTPSPPSEPPIRSSPSLPKSQPTRTTPSASSSPTSPCPSACPRGWEFALNSSGLLDTFSGIVAAVAADVTAGAGGNGGTGVGDSGDDVEGDTTPGDEEQGGGDGDGGKVLPMAQRGCKCVEPFRLSLTFAICPSNVNSPITSPNISSPSPPSVPPPAPLPSTAVSQPPADQDASSSADSFNPPAMTSNPWDDNAPAVESWQEWLTHSPPKGGQQQQDPSQQGRGQQDRLNPQPEKGDQQKWLKPPPEEDGQVQNPVLEGIDNLPSSPATTSFTAADLRCLPRPRDSEDPSASGAANTNATAGNTTAGANKTTAGANSTTGFADNDSAAIHAVYALTEPPALSCFANSLMLTLAQNGDVSALTAQRGDIETVILTLYPRAGFDSFHPHERNYLTTHITALGKGSPGAMQSGAVGGVGAGAGGRESGRGGDRGGDAGGTGGSGGNGGSSNMNTGGSRYRTSPGSPSPSGPLPGNADRWQSDGPSLFGVYFEVKQLEVSETNSNGSTSGSSGSVDASAYGASTGYVASVWSADSSGSGSSSSDGSGSSSTPDAASESSTGLSTTVIIVIAVAAAAAAVMAGIAAVLLWCPGWCHCSGRKQRNSSSSSGGGGKGGKGKLFGADLRVFGGKAFDGGMMKLNGFRKGLGNKAFSRLLHDPDSVLTTGALDISYTAIEAATHRFSERNLLGRGTFGRVYKATLPNGLKLAIKRLDLFVAGGESGRGGGGGGGGKRGGESKGDGSLSRVEGSRDAARKLFVEQVEALSLMRCPYIVPLLGYSTDGVSAVLAYEFVPNGSLHEHLHVSGRLDWMQRVRIAVAIARGLQSLHQRLVPIGSANPPSSGGHPNAPSIAPPLHTDHARVNGHSSPSSSDSAAAAAAHVPYTLRSTNTTQTPSQTTTSSTSSSSQLNSHLASPASPPSFSPQLGFSSPHSSISSSLNGSPHTLDTLEESPDEGEGEDEFLVTVHDGVGDGDSYSSSGDFEGGMGGRVGRDGEEGEEGEGEGGKEEVVVRDGKRWVRAVHANLKSSNVLLDNKGNAKVTDYCLSRLAEDALPMRRGGRATGTFGYLAPEGVLFGVNTQRSDVYSFGVILLELISGRRPIDLSKRPDEQSLVSWAVPIIDRDESHLIADPSLRNRFPPTSFHHMATVAAVCVQSEPSFRPTMTQVLGSLLPLVDLADQWASQGKPHAGPARTASPPESGEHGSGASPRPAFPLAKCLICHEHPRNTTVQPCSHNVTCEQCASLLVSRKKQCPLCHKKIERAVTKGGHVFSHEYE